MKRLAFFLLIVATLATTFYSCKTNTDDLWDSIHQLDGRVTSLEDLCKQMNGNISSLQKLVQALQDNNSITMVTPVKQGDKTIGYTISFTKGEPITIYHGEKGDKGEQGDKGETGDKGDTGDNGKDGNTPIIGVKQYTDGIYYWTLNGDWLQDQSGKMVKAEGKEGADGNDGANGEDGANGKDGITPLLEIRNGRWYLSTDNGKTWSDIGQATGEAGKDGMDGKDGDSFFQGIDYTSNPNLVIFTLGDGTVLEIPTAKRLSITFSETEDIRILANQTYSIQYIITGATNKTQVKALAQDGFRAVVKPTDSSSGAIEVTTPANIVSSEVLVFVSNGEEHTVMRSINFVEGVINITDRSYIVPYTGGTISVELSTNIDYIIEIPEIDKSWISIAPTSRTTMRDETITFNIQQNSSTQLRYSIIKLVDKLGVTSETIQISQRGGSSQDIHVATAGTLEQQISSEDAKIIEELRITGHLNTFDYEFLKTMLNLQTVDLSKLNDTTIPASAFSGSKVSTILLPLELKIISDRAFYQSAITSLHIPEKVESIGRYAFAETSKLTGDVLIPKRTITIDDYAFYKSAFDGTLILEEGVQNIGESAFASCKKTQGNLVIPNSVTTLGIGAFMNSTFTGSLTIGSGLTIIPTFAFQGCSSFKGKITIGENVESIGGRAFEGCVGFTGNLIIPDKVETIGIYAFNDCTGFKGYLTIGAGMKEIGYCAFTRKAPNHHLSLFFSKVFCKTLVCPTLNMLDTSEHIVTAFGTEFYYPSYLGVPVGTGLKYSTDNYWQYFDLIEEVEL